MAYLVNDDLAIEIDDGEDTLQTIDGKSSYSATVAMSTIDPTTGCYDLRRTDTNGDNKFNDKDDPDLWPEEVTIDYVNADADVVSVTFDYAAFGGSGTGVYDPFLHLSGNSGTVTGFNSEGGVGDSTSTWTHRIQIKDLPIYVDSEGNEYYEIQFDLNEPNNATSGDLTLHEFQIFTTGDGTNFADYDQMVAASELRYDIDGIIDSCILLRDDSTGSGTDDYVVRIPVETLGDASANDYFYVNATFGDVEEGGFEEFKTAKAGTISGTKFWDADGDGVQDDGEAGIEGVEIWIDLNNDGDFDLGVDRITTTDANGNYQFTGVLLGTYNIYENITVGDPYEIDGVEYFWTADWDNTTGTRVFDGDVAIGAVQSATLDDDVRDVDLDFGNFDPDPSFNIVKSVSVYDTYDHENPENNTDDDLDGDQMVDSTSDVLEYTITLTNTGNVALEFESLTDTMLGVNITPTWLADNELTIQDVFEGDTDNDGLLDVDETWTYVGTTSLSAETMEFECSVQGDNEVTNTATGDFIGVAAQDAEADVGVVCPSIDIIKTAVMIDSVTGPDVELDGLGNRPADFHVDEDGDIIHYQFAVTNTGDVDLTDPEVTDPLIGASTGLDPAITAVDENDDGVIDGDDGDGILNPGETWLYTGSYTADQDDLDSHGDSEINDPGGDDDDLQIDNTASATATYEGETVGPATDDEDVPIDLDPSFNIVKSVSVYDTYDHENPENNTDDDLDGDQMVDSTSDVLEYTITLTNTGNVALEFESLTDTMLGVNITPTWLADNELTIQDVFEGDTDNDGLLDVDETWTYVGTTQLDQQTLDEECADDEDQEITNTVTGDFIGVAAQDAEADVGIACPEIDIIKTAVMIDSVTGLDVELDGLGNRPADFHVDEDGDIIHYQFAVTNTGNVDLTDPEVTDPLIGASTGLDPAITAVDENDDGVIDGDDGDGILNPGETWLYTGSYTADQDDLDSHGDSEINDPGGDDDDLQIDNTASATATYEGETVGPATDDEDVPIELNPDIKIDKYVTAVDGGIGLIIDSVDDVVYYTMEVTNIGNVALGNVQVADPLLSDLPLELLDPADSDEDGILDTGDLDGDGLLDLDETWIYEGSYTVDSDDITSDGTEEPNDLYGRGSLDNLATVTADDPRNPEGDPVTDDDDASVPIISELGWFGTPGFWKNWCEFFDGIEGNEPKQTGQDFFPTGEMTTTRINDEGVEESGIWIDCDNDGEIGDGEFWTSAWLKSALEGGTTKGPKNAVDILSRDLAALVLNLAANPQNAGDDDPNDGVISPIELVKWANAWIEAQDGPVRTNHPDWKNPFEGLPISAQEMHEFIDEANNYGTVDGMIFGVDRDLEDYGLPDEFIEAYYTVLAVEEADAMLELKSSTALLGDYTADKEADGSLTIMPKTDTSDTDMMSFYEMDSMPLFDYFGGGFEMDTKSAFSAASYFEMPDINIGKFGFTSALIQDSVAAFVPSSPFADQPMKYDAGLDVGVYDIDADDLFVF